MKLRIVVLLLAICLLLTACVSEVQPSQTNVTKTSPSITQPDFGATNADDLKPMPGFDAQNKYLLTTFIGFQETDNFFCGTNSNGHYLQYYDKPSGISGTLCANPACTHDSADCGACIEMDASLSFYDGKLYWIGKDSDGGNDFILWQSDLSGMNRKEVVRLSYRDVIMEYQPQQFAIHRGRLYLRGYANAVVGTQAGLRITLVSISLDGSGELTVHYDESFANGVESTMRFVGDYVYFSVSVFKGIDNYDLTITRYNSRTGEAMVIYEVTELDEAIGKIWVTEQGVVYLPTADADHAYVWKFENGKRVQILSWDEKDYNVPNIVDEIAVITGRTDGIRYIKVNSLDGTTVCDGMMFPEGISNIEGDPNVDYYLGIIGGDTNKIILNIEGIKADCDYTIMLDLNNNLKPTILWSNQE